MSSPVSLKGASQGALVVKNLLANRGDLDRDLVPVRKIPWRRAWLPTPVFLPGESPWTEEPAELTVPGPQESETAEQLALSGALSRGALPASRS